LLKGGDCLLALCEQLAAFVVLVDVFTFFVEKAVSSQKVSVFFPKSFSFYSHITDNQCIMI
jgi:hypothetical protein